MLLVSITASELQDVLQRINISKSLRHSRSVRRVQSKYKSFHEMKTSEIMSSFCLLIAQLARMRKEPAVN